MYLFKYMATVDLFAFVLMYNFVFLSDLFQPHDMMPRNIFRVC